MKIMKCCKKILLTMKGREQHIIHTSKSYKYTKPALI